MDLNDKIGQITQQAQAAAATPTYASLFKTEACKAKILNSLNRERLSQESKKSNIIISGLTLPDNPDDTAQLQIVDQETIKEIAKDLDIDLSTTNFTTRRFGKINDENKQKVLVKLNAEKRKVLLNKARSLRTKLRWENVFINPDLTKAQEEAQYLLRRELREKRQLEPTKRWVINRGQIVEQNQTRPVTPLI